MKKIAKKKFEKALKWFSPKTTSNNTKLKQNYKITTTISSQNCNMQPQYTLISKPSSKRPQNPWNCVQFRNPQNE